MDDLLIRGVLSAPLGLLIPFGVRVLQPKRLVRAAIAAAFVLAAVAIHHDDRESWVIIASTGLVALALPSHWYTQRPSGPIVAAFAIAVFATVLTDEGVVARTLTDLADDRDLVVVTAGGLFCVFVGGAVIGCVMHPVAAKVNAPPRGMENAGRYIGWLERSLLYVLILVGSPEAAAIVIAAKSIARFPSFSREDFAEYYLIGSLLSLLVALASGLAVRAALGHPVAS
jgi:hypothetical protein